MAPWLLARVGHPWQVPRSGWLACGTVSAGQWGPVCRTGGCVAGIVIHGLVLLVDMVHTLGGDAAGSTIGAGVGSRGVGPGEAGESACGYGSDIGSIVGTTLGSGVL